MSKAQNGHNTITEITHSEPQLLQDSARTRKLTFRFMLTGLLAIVVIVALLTAAGYYVVRTAVLQTTIKSISQEMNEMVLTRVQSEQLAKNPRLLNAMGKALANIWRIKKLSVYDLDAKLIWPGSMALELSKEESNQLTEFKRGRTQPRIYDRNFRQWRDWQTVFSSPEKEMIALAPLISADKKYIGVAKILINPQRNLQDARNFSIGLLLALLLASKILFSLLYLNFRKGVQTIEKQQKKMNEQISRLSNLLLINKGMQRSIKTASARGVELNEQFLRRTGADLHDGPAQMIGFAAMRLNSLSTKESVKSLGHEFHTIKGALDQSLDEIRGISTGLVLPELANLTFEQCLRKVVLLHGTKSDVEVTQFHAEVPDNIALPIKICAYRFLQETLTNADRHGKATECRLRTSYRDGLIEISLKDNGQGFRKSQLSTDGGHLGLVGMKDRIESIGGKFSISSELGVGTVAVFSVNLLEDH